jgi:hypothetical protein
MKLREFFVELADIFDSSAPIKDSPPGQVLVKKAPQVLAQYCPPDYEIKSGGGKGMPTFTPWVGFFNPDETTTPQEGLYVVYLLSADKQVLALTLNQGMEYLRTSIGDREARLRLQSDATEIRNSMITNGAVLPTDDIDLRSNGERQKAYTSGNIACRMYQIDSLPSNEVLVEHLAEFLEHYAVATETKKSLLLSDPGSIGSPSPAPDISRQNPLEGFRPKNATDYVSILVGRHLIKTRRHEKLVKEFGEYAITQGFVASTPHPQDLVLKKGTETILIEAKVVYKSNPTDAVRAAVGQLFAYSHFLYGVDKPKLIALFSEPVGIGYVEFLKTLGIDSIWWEDGVWAGQALPS